MYVPMVRIEYRKPMRLEAVAPTVSNARTRIAPSAKERTLLVRCLPAAVCVDA